MRQLIRLKYWLLVMWLSSKWVFRLNLGDLVWYQGRKHVLCNGTTPHHWDIEDWETRERAWVHERELRKVWSPTNLAGSFAGGYRFYMRNWFDIWVRQGIQPWMKGCRIW